MFVNFYLAFNYNFISYLFNLFEWKGEFLELAVTKKHEPGLFLVLRFFFLKISDQSNGFVYLNFRKFISYYNG